KECRELGAVVGNVLRWTGVDRQPDVITSTHIQDGGAPVRVGQTNLAGLVLRVGADPNAIRTAFFDCSNRGFVHSAQNDQCPVGVGNQVDPRGIGAGVWLYSPASRL